MDPPTFPFALCTPLLLRMDFLNLLLLSRLGCCLPSAFLCLPLPLYPLQPAGHACVCDYLPCASVCPLLVPLVPATCLPAFLWPSCEPACACLPACPCLVLPSLLPCLLAGDLPSPATSLPSKPCLLLLPKTSRHLANEAWDKNKTMRETGSKGKGKAGWQAGVAGWLAQWLVRAWAGLLIPS